MTGQWRLEKARDWPGLLAHCRRWTQAEPCNDCSLVLLGVAYGRLGRHREAIEAYREALRLKPDCLVWLLPRVLLTENGPFQEAIAAYREALAP